MSIIRAFLESFGILFAAACVVISVVLFGRLWFGERQRAAASMHQALSGRRQRTPFFFGIWSVLQGFLVTAFGVVVMITIGLLSLFWVPLVYGWYRIRRKPLPTLNHDLNDVG